MGEPNPSPYIEHLESLAAPVSPARQEAAPNGTPDIWALVYVADDPDTGRPLYAVQRRVPPSVSGGHPSNMNVRTADDAASQQRNLNNLRAVSGGQPEPNWKALGRSAVEAAQTVIGQCDCIMSEDAAKDPKRIWREARAAYWRAARPSPEGSAND